MVSLREPDNLSSKSQDTPLIVDSLLCKRLEDFIFVLERCGKEGPEKLRKIGAFHRGSSQ